MCIEEIESRKGLSGSHLLGKTVDVLCESSFNRFDLNTRKQNAKGLKSPPPKPHKHSIGIVPIPSSEDITIRERELLYRIHPLSAHLLTMSTINTSSNRGLQQLNTLLLCIASAFFPSNPHWCFPLLPKKTHTQTTDGYRW